MSMKAKKTIKFKRTNENTPTRSLNTTPRNFTIPSKQVSMPSSPSKQVDKESDHSSLNIITQPTSLHQSRPLSIKVNVSKPEGNVVELVDHTTIFEIPEKHDSQRTRSLNSSLMKNKQLNKSKRAALDAGEEFINEAELVKNYYDMKGKIGPKDIEDKFSEDIWH